MKLFTTLFALASSICVAFSFTCTNEGDSDIDVRFNKTTFSYCYHIPTVECGYGTYIPILGHTCRLLSVKVTNHSLVTPDYTGSERCGCIDAVYGSLVMLIDANPAVVTNAEWELRIIDSLDWFYHGVTQERVPGSIFNITYLFLHGSSYLETKIGETYDVFQGSNLTSNPWSALASTEAITYPCNAINRAIDILKETAIDYRSRRRLFYWGFSTPDLANCGTSGLSFKDVSTYAMRQTLAVNLSAIESIYGDFTECDWYQATSDSDPLESEAIQNRAVIGTLSDFICAIEETAAPSSPPTKIPTTASPTAISVLPVTVSPPPTPKPTPSPTKQTPSPTKQTPSPTLKPTAAWWNATPKPTYAWWSVTPKPTSKPTQPTQKPTQPTSPARQWWSF